MSTHPPPLSASEAPAPVRRAFLSGLYTHLATSNTVFTVVALFLCHPVARTVLSTNPLLALLLVPVRLGWWLALAGWARLRHPTTSASPSALKLRAVLSCTLSAAAHILDALFMGLLLALALDLAESFNAFDSSMGLYPAISWAFFALWSSYLGALVAILTADTSTAPATPRIAAGVTLGTTVASVVLAFTGRICDMPVVLLVPGIVHAVLLYDLPRMMAHVGPEEAALGAHVLGSPSKLALILRLSGTAEVEVEKEMVGVPMASEKQEVV